MKAPRGQRYLLITCADPSDGQFRGVQQACRLLQDTEGVRAVARRDGRRVAPAPTASPGWVVVSGHGSEDDAWVGDGRGHGLRPSDLGPMPGLDLYLLACYQGREQIRRKWGDATGASARGCAGETETALSTLFLLALLDHGPRSAPHWFDLWLDANDRLRPQFPEMRRLYEERGRDFAASIGAIAAIVDLGPFRDILAVAERNAGVLSGLGRAV